MVAIYKSDQPKLQKLMEKYPAVSVTTKTYQYKGMIILSIQSSNLDLMEEVYNIDPELNKEVNKY